MKTIELFKVKKLPDWVKNHPVFNEVKEIKKVFPGIGLSNCEEETQIDNTTINESASALLNEIHHLIQRRIDGLNKFISNKDTMKDDRKKQGALCLEMLSVFNNSMSRSKKAFIKNENGRIAIKVPNNITLSNDNKPTFREGESLFRVYNKINTGLRAGKFAAMTKLEDLYQFKAFSADNVPNNDKLKIIFSSDGIDGAWDIATMSQRGISSCQSWNGDYSHCLIGSVIDPFVGIMYLTSGANIPNYGKKMIKRAIVRFAVSYKNDKPVLLLDNLYPGSNIKIRDAFIKFLKDKTQNKFDVLYTPEVSLTCLKDYYLPNTKVRDLLKKYSRDGNSSPIEVLDSIRSYQDTKIADKTSYNKTFYSKIVSKFNKLFNTAVEDAIAELDMAEVPDDIKPFLKKMTGGYKHYTEDFSKQISAYFIKLVDKSNILEENNYLTKLFYSYFNNKKKYLNDSKTKLARDINGKFHLQNKDRVSPNNIYTFMNILLPYVDKKMKVHIRELFKK